MTFVLFLFYLFYVFLEVSPYILTTDDYMMTAYDDIFLHNHSKLPNVWPGRLLWYQTCYNKNPLTETYLKYKCLQGTIGSSFMKLYLATNQSLGPKAQKSLASILIKGKKWLGFLKINVNLNYFNIVREEKYKNIRLHSQSKIWSI